MNRQPMLPKLRVAFVCLFVGLFTVALQRALWVWPVALASQQAPVVSPILSMATALYHPVFLKNDNDYITTIYVQNITTQTASVALTFSDGTIVSDTIPAKGTLKLAAGDIATLADGVYSLRVNANQSIESVVRIERLGGELSLYRGLLPSEVLAHQPSSSTNLIDFYYGIPFFKSSTLWLTNLNLSNETSVDTIFYDFNGTFITTTNNTLNPGESLSLFAGEISALPADFEGWVEVQSTESLASQLIQVNHDNNFLEHQPIFGGGFFSSHLPRALKGYDEGAGARSTDIFVSNIGTSPAEVELRYYNLSGTLVLTRTYTLTSLGAQLIALDDEAELPNNNLWAVHLSSTQPVIFSEVTDDTDITDVSGTYESLTALELTLPRLSRQSDTHTVFSVQNASLQGMTTTGVINYYDLAGSLALTQTLLLPPNGWIRYDQSLISELGSEFEGSAIIRANGPIRAWVDEYMIGLPATATPTPTNTSTPTNTPTHTSTITPGGSTLTPTNTPSTTPTPSMSNTASPSPTSTTSLPTLTASTSPTIAPRVAQFPFYDGFEGAPEGVMRQTSDVPHTLGTGWAGIFTRQGAIRVSAEAAAGGGYGLLIDDQVADDIASTAALILTINLADQSDVELEFKWREFNDENHPDDGLFISDDRGANWYKILSFNNGPSDFQLERIQLDDALMQHGLTYNSEFQIKFQFYDNHPAPNDGYAIDEVRVQSESEPPPPPIATDPYEDDNSCDKARTIVPDGAIQERSFHEEADEDWLKIEASAAITYVIEARVPPASNADLALELYNACDGQPDGEDPNFSADIRLTFSPPADGTYYLRLRNHNEEVYGAEVTYHVSVRDAKQAASAGAGALIILGGKLRENDLVQENIDHVTNSIYNFARTNGCSADQIYYLAPDMSLDGDGDGLPDVNALANPANLEAAITEWALSRVSPTEPLTLYLMDHGASDTLFLNGANESVTTSQLDEWLSELEESVPGLESNIIVEACQSGSFISPTQSMSRDKRVLISSTGDLSLAYASEEGAVFSDAFLDALAQGMNLQAAFDEGASAADLAHPDQTAWLDDTGDGRYEPDSDGELAALRGFACAAPPPGELWAPFIVQAQAQDGTISAEVRDDKGVESVKAIIYPPGYSQPDSSQELIPDPEPIFLEAQGNDLYSVELDELTETGTYRIVLYAEDEDGLTSRPKEVLARGSWQIYLPIVER